MVSSNAAILQIIVAGKDQASQILNDVNKSAGGLGKALGDVGKIAAGVFAGGALLGGAQKLGGFLMDATKAAAEDAASTERLRQAYKNTGAEMAAFNEFMADNVALGQKRAFSDDQVRDSLSLLTAQTGSATEAQDRFALAMDLARGANIDVVTASKLLGKVTEENVNVLARYGISMKEGASEAELFGAIQQKFGGQAAAFADTTAGKWQQAQIRFGEMKEALGAQLLPVMTKVMDFLVTTAIPVLERFIQKIGPDVTKAVNDVVSFVKQHWPEISAVIQFAADFVQTQIEGVIQTIRGIVEVVTSTVNLVKAVFRGDWAAAWKELQDIAGGALDILIGTIKRMFGSLPEIALNAIRSLGRSILGELRGIANGVIEVINSAVSAYNSTLGKVAGSIDKVGLIQDPGTTYTNAGNVFGSYASGTNYVPQTGPYLLHQGEAVIPAGQNRGGVTVNVYGSILSERDITRIVRDAVLGGGFRGVFA